MRIDSRTDGVRGLLVNMETGKPIRAAIWADLDTGEYEAFKVDEKGAIMRDNRRVPLKYTGKARLSFIPTQKTSLTGLMKQASSQPKPQSAPRSTGKIKYEHIEDFVLLKIPCEHYGCIRIAEWLVSDEMETEPVLKDKKLYPTAKTVDMHAYCSWHFQPPRIVDEKGEVVEVIEDAGGVRPD